MTAKPVKKEKLGAKKLEKKAPLEKRVALQRHVPVHHR
jgi:hypothetical protein